MEAMLMKATNHFSMKAAANRWFKGIVSLFYSMIYPWHFNAAHIFVVMTAGNYVEVLNGSISIFCPESTNAMLDCPVLHAMYFQCLKSLQSLFRLSLLTFSETVAKVCFDFWNDWSIVFSLVNLKRGIQKCSVQLNCWPIRVKKNVNKRNLKIRSKDDRR